MADVRPQKANRNPPLTCAGGQVRVDLPVAIHCASRSAVPAEGPAT
ncbi:hypothetical protein QRX60_43825 [Amycolatopsis mongoliensis]|uniref:Uncharacterized protein n=1 Tax=Amycolatopsis mongoliensis TaxID=715475 RepID=A0A9Y2NQ77_9PSEU|nr:hypothetical protein [Amycolatopsis sp. 4-36]WIY07668.1 hypothetical protein QRX60_43825 [Amycolatopsis sp. 4-36]